MEKNFQTKFVEQEITKIQKRFNNTFGQMIVCNLKTRQSVILAICGLGLLAREIIKTQDENTSTRLIKKFVRTTNVLNNYFQDQEKKGEPYDCSMSEMRKKIRGSVDLANPVLQGSFNQGQRQVSDKFIYE